MSSPASMGPQATRPALGGLRWYFDVYLAHMKISIATGFQYRVANYFYMIGMIAEPVIYLVVWSTIATQQGGEIGGFTPGDFAAYYIVWTLVRQFNIVFTPYGWEPRIREGDLNGMLLRPLFPMHVDIAMLAGWKFVVVVLWLPIAAALVLLFQPTFDPRLIDVAVFVVAIWGAYLVRTMIYWALGLVAFWTTRVGPAFELMFTLELLLSGRLLPLSLMPDWAQRLADLLPFKWTFGYPIEALIGKLPTDQLLGGLAMQALWIAIGAIVARLLWGVAIRRYSAVGNSVPRDPLRWLRLLGLYFRIGALNELQYRANLAVELIQSAIALVTGLAVLGLVFSQTGQLNGWTEPELLAVMGVHILMGGVIYALIEPNMTRLMNDVREGKLDFMLTKPEDAQVLVSVPQVKIWRLSTSSSGRNPCRGDRPA